MIDLVWEQQRGIWKGTCPRCGVSSFFQLVSQKQFSNSDHIDVVECPGGHPFVIATKANTKKTVLRFVSPVSGKFDVPDWLPEQYERLFSEMMFDYYSGKYASTIAVAGIILDAHINSFLKKRGDRRKGLKKRLDLLAENQIIDADEFADSTVARLARNDVIHPDDIADEITKEDASEVVDAVKGCLERYYKFRRAKALPAPEELVENPDTPDEPEDITDDDKSATSKS